MRVSWLLLLALCSCTILLRSLPAVEAAPRQAAQSFVGWIPETDAFVAVVTNGQAVVAYLCDGTEEAGISVYGWFRGTLAG